MFVIFGWPKLTSGRQSLGVYCSACQRNTVHKAFTQQSWLSLFFIPIIPIGAKTAARDMQYLRARRA